MRNVSRTSRILGQPSTREAHFQACLETIEDPITKEMSGPCCYCGNPQMNFCDGLGCNGNTNPTVFGGAINICRECENDFGMCQQCLRKGARPFSAKFKSCPVCGKRDGLRKCARCKRQVYCSVECQKKHWKHHKVTCRRPPLSIAQPPSRLDESVLCYDLNSLIN